MDEHDVALLGELAETAKALLSKTDLDEILTDYELIREIVQELEMRDKEVSEIAQDIWLKIINVMSQTMPDIVKNVYENAQKKVAEAKNLEDKSKALEDALEFFGRIDQYTEQTLPCTFKRAVDALTEYQSKLERAIANEIAAKKDLEFRKLIEGITFTATEKQIRYLLDLGAKPIDLNGITKQQASVMIDRLAD